MRKNPVADRKRSSGMTLIEILITLLVISIGLLGVAGLHSLSLRNNYDALMRSHASALANEMADRMRVSRDLVYVANSEYVTQLSDERPTVVADSSQPVRDIAEWLRTVEQQLPEGDGAIAIDLNTRIVTITVQWGERGNTMTFATQTEV